MDTFIVLTLIVVTVATLTKSQDIDYSNSKILKYSFTKEVNGPYNFEYLTSDGQSREENAILTDANTKHESLLVTGSYSFTASDGKVYTVHYTADENGFHPVGDHIKVPSYTPWPKGHHHEDDDGQYHPHHHEHATPHQLGDNVPENLNIKPVIVQNDVPPPIASFRNAYIPSTPSPKPVDDYVSATPSVTPKYQSTPVINVRVSDNNAGFNDNNVAYSQGYDNTQNHYQQNYGSKTTTAHEVKPSSYAQTNYGPTQKHIYPNNQGTSTPIPTTIAHPQEHSTYLPSTPKINVKVTSDSRSYGSEAHVSTAYLPSSTISHKSVTVSGIHHETASSSPIGVISKPRGFHAKREDTKASLFEVIQNNHSSGGVFDKEEAYGLLNH